MSVQPPEPLDALLIDGGFVYTADAADRILPDGSILALDGRIAAVGGEDVRRAVDALSPAVRATMRSLDARGMIVLPGFVNAHWHECFVSYLLRPTGLSQPVDDRHDPAGPFAHGGDVRALSMQFDTMAGLPEQLRPDEAAAIARYSLWTQLRSGTTTIGDVGSLNRPEALVAALGDLGLRGAVSIWTSDARCEPGETRFRRTRDADELLADMEGLLASCDRGDSARIRAMPSVIYSANMSDELGAGMSGLVERFDAPFATHLGALRNEAEVVRSYFGATPIRRFARLGLLNDHLLAVHCAFADAQERDMLIDAGVRISHSPAKYGTSGEPTITATGLIPALRAEGVDVSLSTDGDVLPIGGMIEAMACAVHSYNEFAGDNSALASTAALAMASRTAARALRWDDEVGSLQVGKQADLVLIPMQDWRYFLRPRPLDGLLRLGSSNDVDTVIVGGRVLLRGGAPALFDEAALREEFVAALTSFAGRREGIRLPVLDALARRDSLATRRG